MMKKKLNDIPTIIEEKIIENSEINKTEDINSKNKVYNYKYTEEIGY